MSGCVVCGRPVEGSGNYCKTHDTSEENVTSQDIDSLLAEFQRVQHASVAAKLSERNCIQVIQKLLDLHLLDAMYTLDGKEYVTPEYLEREIMDELYVRSGELGMGVKEKKRC